MGDGQGLGYCSNCQLAVDTGTSLLAVPSRHISRLTDRLRISRDCSAMHKLPILAFRIREGFSLTLSPKEYVDKASGAGCLLSLMSLDIPPPRGPVFILGDPLLRKYLTV